MKALGMPQLQEGLKNLQFSGNTLFLMLGAVMIFAMHAGFAFLEIGTVRQKNQVNAAVKIIPIGQCPPLFIFSWDFLLPTALIFWMNAGDLSNLFNGVVVPGARGFDLVHCFFLTTFAGCVPAIISGGIAERAKFWPQLFAGALFAGVCYPLFESMIWGHNAFFQSWLTREAGAKFHDYAGSVVVHSMGGWLALPRSSYSASVSAAGQMGKVRAFRCRASRSCRWGAGYWPSVGSVSTS